MRKLQTVLMVLSLLCFAVPAFADGGAPVNLNPIGIGIGIALAAGLCGIGQGRAVGSAVESVARNPGASGTIQLLMILGLAFIESLTLFTFAMIFIRIKP
ncbi:MAG TPA: ATP synthase F0 subunit C [Terracidiphilus sp.]|jgi:F-type H+-transporting ATPase subunit c